MRTLLALVLLLAGCSMGRPAEDATGSEIYAQLCANCHGDDLSGGLGPALGPDTNAAEQPDSFLRVTIEHGRGRMPSFSSTLDEAQIARLIVFIREVQAG